MSRKTKIYITAAVVFFGLAGLGTIMEPPDSKPAPPPPAVESVEKAPVVEKAEYTFAVETTPEAVYTLFIDGDMVLYESTGPDMVTRKFDTEDEDTVIILDQKTDFGEVVLTIMNEDRNIVGQIKTTADESHWGGTVQLGRRNAEASGILPPLRRGAGEG